MAAKSKSELLEVTEKGFKKLATLIDSIDADTALEKGGEDTSIKNVIAHRAHWIELFLGWYLNGLAGKIAYFPVLDYK